DLHASAEQTTTKIGDFRIGLEEDEVTQKRIELLQLLHAPIAVDGTLARLRNRKQGDARSPRADQPGIRIPEWRALEHVGDHISVRDQFNPSHGSPSVQSGTPALRPRRPS